MSFDPGVRACPSTRAESYEEDFVDPLAMWELSAVLIFAEHLRRSQMGGEAVCDG